MLTACYCKLWSLCILHTVNENSAPTGSLLRYFDIYKCTHIMYIVWQTLSRILDKIFFSLAFIKYLNCFIHYINVLWRNIYNMNFVFSIFIQKLLISVNVSCVQLIYVYFCILTVLYIFCCSSPDTGQLVLLKYPIKNKLRVFIVNKYNTGKKCKVIPYHRARKSM